MPGLRATRCDMEIASGAPFGRPYPRKEPPAMLILTRGRNQSVMIGRDIEVKIVDIRGDRVRVGFEAPETVDIHRREIYDQILRENLGAAQLQPTDVADILSPGKAPIADQMKGSF